MHRRYEAGELEDYNVRLTRKIVQVLLDDGSITDVTILDHGVRVSLVGKVTMVQK